MSSSAGVCSAITHTGGRCSSAATDASGHCAHHARMARVMALAPKSLVAKVSPPPAVTSYSAAAASASVPSPSPVSSGYKDLFGGGTAASPASSSVSSASSSSFAMTPMSNALPSASDLAPLPGESVATTVSCSFVFPAALGLPELPGALVITTFRLRFEPQSTSLRTPGGFHRLLDAALRGMPRAAVAKLAYPQATATASRSIGPYGNGNGGSVMTPTRLVVKFKDLRSWTLGGDVMRLLPSLNRYAFVDSPLSLFAFLSGSVMRDDQEAHGLYDVYEDFTRMGVALKDGSSAYRVTELNNAFAMCPTYPRQLVVPAAASDNEVGAVASFRSKGRLPICSFVHAHNGAALWRCAQPKRGILHAQSPADEQYLMHIARASTAATSYSATPTRKIWIADCRPELNARVNNLTGGGTESGSLAHARVSFLNIGNIHAMRESLEAVRGLGGFTAISSNTEALDLAWGARVEDTRWLSHVRRVLSGALQVARALEAQATTVVVHCSDGWDRTAQLCALAQLLVDAHYRTRRGFLEVIEKEWVRAGHKFQDRVAPGKAEDDDDQQAPIFLQFLDCVWQLTRSFPTHFEFNARMLETLADALFSGQYGTFLGNCERERSAWHVRERTPSLWALVLRDDRFVNPFYRATSARALLPEAPAVLRQVTLWSEYYFRGATFPAAPMGNSSPPLYAADGNVASGGAQEDLEVAMAAALQRIHLLEDQLHAAKAQAAAAAALPPKPAPVSYPPLYSAASEADMSSQLHPGASNGGVNGYQSYQPSVNGYHHASSNSSNGGREPVAPVAPTSTSTETVAWTCAVCSKANGVEALQCVVCGRTPQ